jgi:hypothetical protein
MMSEFGEEQLEPTTIRCDSQVAIRLTEDDCESDRAKHWDAEFQCIRELTNQRQSAKVKFIPTAECTADVLTKSLTTNQKDFWGTRQCVAWIGMAIRERRPTWVSTWASFS